MATQPNIRRAIERSRRARDRLARRRRRWVIAASLCVAVSVPLSFAAMGVTGGDVARAAENGAQSLAELLNRRSPGARTVAQLTKTKKARALAKVLHAAPAAPATPAPSELAKALLPPAAQVPVELPPPVALLQAVSPPLSVFVGPPGVLVGSPGGVPGGPGGSPGGPGGSTPGGGPPLVTTQPVTVPSAVPEPGTWATMLLGFGLLGWRFRRRGAAQPAVRKDLA